MKTSTLKLYKVNFSSSKNVYIDDIETYLAASESSGLVVDDYQYIRHGLDITIKLDLSQDVVNDLDLNYMSITNTDEDSYYYFIDKTEQVAVKTVRFYLHLDTVNTLGTNNVSCDPRNFEPTTLITRQHEDRFVQDDNWRSSHKLVRKVDKVVEDVAPDVNIKTKELEITDNNSAVENLGPWYIIFSAPNGSTGVNLNIGITTLKGFTYREKYNYYRFTVIGDLAQNYVISKATGGVDQQVTFTRSATYLYVKGSGAEVYSYGTQYNALIRGDDIIYKDNTKYTIKGFYQYFVGNVNITYATAVADDNTYIYEAVYNLQPRLNSLNEFDVVYTDNRYITTDIISNSGEYYWTATEANAKNLTGGTLQVKAVNFWPFHTLPINAFNNTRTELFRILSVPYCPVPWYFSSTGRQLTFESRFWQYSHSGLLEGTISINAASEMLRYINLFPARPLQSTPVKLEYLIKELTDAQKTDLSDATNESKIYNSQFFTSKINYDSFNCQIKPELIDATFNPSSSNGDIDIKYKVSDTLNSTFGFKIDFDKIGNYVSGQDYEGYLIANRNNEYPILNSEYLNYMRNGYNYDKKANALAIESAKKQATTQTIGAAVSIGVGLLDVAFGTKALGIGMIGTGIMQSIGVGNAWKNVKTTQENQEIATQKNLANLEAQGISVAASDDLSMLTWYNKNTLRYFEYSVNDQMKAYLINYFRLFGYKKQSYGTPNVDSRIWYNFIQCTPEIKYEGTKELRKEWIDDLVQRYQSGVTVFHHNTINGTEEYDLDRLHENYETWITG